MENDALHPTDREAIGLWLENDALHPTDRETIGLWLENDALHPTDREAMGLWLETIFSVKNFADYGVSALINGVGWQWYILKEGVGMDCGTY